MPGKSKPNEFKITRMYDAPVKTVWEAWTDVKQVAKWWGPRGFTLTTHGKDLKAGGFWKYTMHGPDGTNYENRTIYHEVVPYKRLVYDHGGSEDRPPLFRVEVDFIDLNGKTKMVMNSIFETDEIAKEMKKFIKAAGGTSTWDRLAEYLETEATGKENFVINRTFNAPVDVMYEMWTNPKHFSKWLAPTGFNMTFIRADIKPGGSTFYYMDNDAGVKMYGRAEYLEMHKPDRLVYVQQFCDEKENMSRHPMAPTWPAFMITKVQFTAEGSDQTRVTVTWEPYGDFTAEELATFVQAKAGMTQGWTGSFDKLEDYLSQQ